MTETVKKNDEIQIAFSDDQVARWDREWIIYLGTEDPEPHLVKSRSLHTIADIAGKSREEVFQTSLCAAADGTVQHRLRVWATGDSIVGKSVLEFGSGTGLLGKNLGFVVEKFLGIDVSELAVAIATSGAHARSKFVHVNNTKALEAHVGQYDTWVAREFFIHQNFNMALNTLRRGRPLLKTGGEVCMDFYQPNYDIEQGVIYPATALLDTQYASCGYYYTSEEVLQLAEATGFTVESDVVNLAEQRRFVVMRKTKDLPTGWKKYFQWLLP